MIAMKAGWYTQSYFVDSINAVMAAAILAVPVLVLYFHATVLSASVDIILDGMVFSSQMLGMVFSSRMLLDDCRSSDVS